MILEAASKVNKNCGIVFPLRIHEGMEEIKMPKRSTAKIGIYCYESFRAMIMVIYTKLRAP